MAPSKFQIYVDQSMRQAALVTATGAPAQPQQLIPQQPSQLIQHQHQAQHQPTITTTTVTTTTTEAPWYQQQQVQKQGDEHQRTDFTSHQAWPRYIKENLDSKKQMFYFDERKIYPAAGGEFSFEELNLISWIRRQSELALRGRCEELEMENRELKSELGIALQQITTLTNALKQLQEQQQYQARENAHAHHLQEEKHHHQQQEQQQLHVLQLQQQQHALQQQPTLTLTSTMSLKQNHSPPNNRLSVVPQSLQPSHCNDADTSCYGQLNEAPSVVQDLWKQTDKFTVPIDQSQYIREHCPTSTPSGKDDKAKKAVGYRRMSRPSMGGSPTMKLSPITETSRDCNSKSSTSASSTTPGNCKRALMLDPVKIDEPDRPLDPNDPTTYRKLLRALAEPLESRSNYIRINAHMPIVKKGGVFKVRKDRYLMDKQISQEANLFTAQLLEDSDESDSYNETKTIVFRYDQPSNDWLFYICDELHERLVRQKIKPDIELSVMNAEPAVIYLNGSIFIDEYFKCLPLEEYIIACEQTNKPFPRSVAAYLTLELIQLVRVIHKCGILHMNVTTKNIVVAGNFLREDIASVDERLALIKLVNFDHAIDTRLLPSDFKFNTKPNYLKVGEMLDSRPWLHEIDWIAVLNCIHKMFFLEDMEPVKDDDTWKVNKQFKGFPTDVWNSLFDGLLNIKDTQETNVLVERVVDELSTWIKANISFVLRGAVSLDMVLESFCKSTNRSIGLY